MKAPKIAAVFVAVLLAVTAAWWMSVNSIERGELEDSIVAYKNGEFEAALPILEHFANRGEPAALRLVATSYLYGYGVDPDIVIALKYLAALDESERHDFCETFIESRDEIDEDQLKLLLECAGRE